MVLKAARSSSVRLGDPRGDQKVTSVREEEEEEEKEEGGRRSSVRDEAGGEPVAAPGTARCGAAGGRGLPRAARGSGPAGAGLLEAGGIGREPGAAPCLSACLCLCVCAAGSLSDGAISPCRAPLPALGT